MNHNSNKRQKKYQKDSVGARHQPKLSTKIDLPAPANQKRQQQMQTKKIRSQKLSILVALVIVLLLALVVGVIWSITAKSATAVKLEISDYEVSEDEFSYALDHVRNEVIQETAEQGSSIGDSYWKSDQPDAPTARAVDKAIALIQQRYAVYQLASECKIVDSPAWESLVQRMGEENAARENNIESGQVIYGNQSFSLETFVDTEIRSIKDAYIANKCDPGVTPNETEIQDYFAAHDWTISDDGTPATLDQVRATVIQEYQFTYFDQLVNQKIKAQKIEADSTQLREFAAHYLSRAN